MKFSLFRDYGAQNSKPVFDAFADSLVSSCLLYTSDAADE